MRKVVIYIHGKGGNAKESEHYKNFFPGYEVIGFDYVSELPWEAADEFEDFLLTECEKCDRLVIVAVSIGAYFTMCADVGRYADEAFFISPIVDMESLIRGMMQQQNVSEAELQEKGTIGDLSWEYLTWVREHPVNWTVPTSILYGGKDVLQSYDMMLDFMGRTRSDVTVMWDAEHWFHTEEQMSFLDNWLSHKVNVTDEDTKCLVPRNKFDVATIDMLTKLDDERFDVIAYELLKWIRDMNWPIAEPVLEVLLSHHEVVDKFIPGLLKPDQNDDGWKFNIITYYLPKLPVKPSQEIMSELERIVIGPTEFEALEEVDKKAYQYIRSFQQ